ncbi:hypothetical protein [Botrimarina sp.]|uniref:hypothetical protein n=1 Tax=Botrimarina sp. TaxID=2795802 RepID=UPI0032EFFA51
MSADQHGSRWLRLAKRVVFFPLVLLLLPIVASFLLCLAVRNATFLVCLWIAWRARGLDTLIVYSNSPNWQDYFEGAVIPAIGRRGAVLNWSERKRWPTLSWSTLAFRFFAGEKEFNPIVVILRPWRQPQTYRFHNALRDAKHGKLQRLREVTGKLSDDLSVEVPMTSVGA